MKAYIRSVRIAPKKANLVAGMVRGLPVPAARESLRRTNKKAARIIEQLLNSAAANAQHNENQNPELLVIKSLIVNKAQAYHRGVPMARGRVRPIRKFLSHISLTLGVGSGEVTKQEKTEKHAKNARHAKSGSSRSSHSPQSSETRETASQKAAEPAQSPKKRASGASAGTRKVPKDTTPPASASSRTTSPKK